MPPFYGNDCKSPRLLRTASHAAMKLSVAPTSTAFWMTGGLLLATLTAVAHHCFYSKVNHRVVHDLNEQEWFSRIGTGLAFSVKTLLAASAGLAYTQLLWCTMKTQPFTLKGLDALFAVVNDAFKFWNWEAWRHGLPLISIALLIWYVDLRTILQAEIDLSSGPSRSSPSLLQEHSLSNRQHSLRSLLWIYLFL